MRQLVGQSCVQCQGRIGSIVEGLFCPTCANPVHAACMRPSPVSGTPSNCPDCGAPLDDATRALLERRRNQPSQERPLRIDLPTEEEIRTFAGSNAEYYVRNWRAHLKGRFCKFNWAGFFFPVLWLPYRRMYTATAVVYAALLLADVVICLLLLNDPWLRSPGVLLRRTYLAAGLFCGFFGNRLYLARAKKVIERYLFEPSEDPSPDQELAKRGGTSLVAPVICVLVLVGGLFLVPNVLDIFL